MRRPVILHHARVIDGKICSTALEIRHRVAARAHGGGYLAVGVADRSDRVVDEERLHALPLLRETVAVLLGKRMDRNLFAPLLALFQGVLGLRASAVFA